MISLKNIRTVARYERKILLRSWFFRIFAFLTLLFLTAFNGGMIFGAEFWPFRSSSAALVYNNVFMLNIAQSIIAVFLASDFMKRDKKLDTAEVLFIRPMSNLDYVLGKTRGVVSIFVLLNVLVLLLTSVYVFASGEIPFNIWPFIAYFLLISIPSLTFILGLSFFLMGVVKNQSITFLILLAYIAVVLFYLGDKNYFVFDYLSFHMPLMYSDIIGFDDLASIIAQRLGYLCLGLTFIFSSVLLLKRLSQKVTTKIIATLSIVLFGLLSAGAFYQYLQPKYDRFDLRKNMIAQSEDYFNYGISTITNCNIELEHGETLKAEVDLSLKNETKEAIDTFLFSLNPGLKVQAVQKNDNEQLSFEQKGMLLFIVPDQQLQPNAKTSLSISYEGEIDPSVAYLDVEEKKRIDPVLVNTIRYSKSFGMYTEDFVLLTIENLWYPISGVRYDPTKPAVFRQQFTNFKLKVKTRSDLVAVSQGKVHRPDSLSYQFIPRDPLPQISLNIGKYKEYSVDVDGLDISMFVSEENDYFEKYFTELTDTATALITEFLDNFERPINIFYPYPRFKLVEVPLMYTSMEHSWTSAMAHSQPQLVMLPEKGFNVRQADFKDMKKDMDRRNKRNNEGLSDKDIQASIFANFLSATFGSENLRVRFRSVRNGVLPINPYNIFPNYYNYVNFISSNEFPILNYAFENYLKKTGDDPRQIFMSRSAGLGDVEKASLKLDGKSLKEIIASEEDKNAVNRVLKAKGDYLLTWIQKHVGGDDFDEFMLDFLYENSYRDITYQEFSEMINEKFEVDLNSFVQEWYKGDKIPAYVYSGIEVFQTVLDQEMLFIVKVKVTNGEPVGGIVKFTFRSGGGRSSRGGSSMGESEERIYYIGPNETREIQMVLMEQPRGLMFNTMISKNIPSTKMDFVSNVKRVRNYDAVEYDVVVNDPVQISIPGEIIIDNTSEGFTIVDPDLNNPIKKLFKKEKTEEERFTGIGFGASPTEWSLAADDDYYGKYEKSAMFIRSGEGQKKAVWTTVLPEEGYYDVFVYLDRGNFRSRSSRGGGDRGSRGGEGGRPSFSDDIKGSLFYEVYHEDGQEEVEFVLNDIEDEWSPLGSFYFAADTAKIVLSDKATSNRVVADAVKFVKQK